MKRVSCLTVAIILGTVALAAEKEDPLTELDAKIAQNPASDKWNDASKAFVGALWDDYRKAHVVSSEGTSTRSVFGKMPDVEQYEDYLGALGRGPDPGRAFLEITKDQDGRFYVELEGHTFPAVQRNRTVVFTTGDVVFASMPTLAERPYCTLEIFMAIRTGGKFFFGSPSTPPDKWMQLSKLIGE